MTDQRNNKPRPAETLRDGNVKATIWRNQNEKGAFYNTKFSRSYQDQEGKFHESEHFQGTDMLKIGRLADRAYDKERQLRQLDRTQAQSPHQGADKEAYVKDQQNPNQQPNQHHQRNNDPSV